MYAQKAFFQGSFVMYRDAYGNYPDLKGVKKILVIKLRHLGDVLLTGPVFSALKSALPEAKIDAFIWSECVPMLEGHPAVSGWIEYDRGWKKLGFFKKIFKEFSLLRKIRRQKYDLVINLTEGDRGALAAKASKARVRVGFDPKKKGFWGKKKLYTHVVKVCPGVRHTVERNLDAVRRLRIFPMLSERELFLHVPETARSYIHQLAQNSYVLIHPASRWRFKCWPVESMRELVKELSERGERLIFTSGPDVAETAMVEEIIKGFSVLNLAGKISLKELAALIQGAKALICVDSAPLHMASALKVPTVALFGPSSEKTWGPWRNDQARVVVESMSCRPCYQDGCGGSKVSDCLHSLPVAKVLAAYDSLEGVPCSTY